SCVVTLSSQAGPGCTPSAHLSLSLFFFVHVPRSAGRSCSTAQAFFFLLFPIALLPREVKSLCLLLLCLVLSWVLLSREPQKKHEHRDTHEGHSMPSNLFVVVFPRRVQAHTIVVDKKASAKKGWSVGGLREGLREGLRSPSGLLQVGSHGKFGRRDSEFGQSQGPGHDSTSGSPTSGSVGRDGSSVTHQGSVSASSASRNELKNQKTVRVQLSRPTEDNMDPETGTPKKERRGSQLLQRQKASWHAPMEGVSVARMESALGGGGGGSGSSDSTRKQQKEGDSLASSLSKSSQRGPTDGDGTVAVDARGPEEEEGFSGEAGGAAGGSADAAVDEAQQERGGGEKDQPVKDPTDERASPSSSSAAAATGEGEGEGEDATSSGEEKGGASEMPPPAPLLGHTGAGGGGHRRSGEAKDAEEGGPGDREAREESLVPSTEGSNSGLVTEVLGDDDVDVSRPQEKDVGEKVDIEKMVRGIMVEMRGDMLLIGEPTYHISASGKLMTCIFPCDAEDAHLVLTRLESVGVGSETGSVNVLPMEIGRSDITRRRRDVGQIDKDKARRSRHSSRMSGSRLGSSSGAEDGERKKDEDDRRSANERFRALASQIRVTQVTEEIRQGTKWHFDYVALLVASSTISAMGLATDNVAVVVAAMLVSPIMGPVLAFTFGTNVRDWSLAKKGFIVESMSLLICVLVGFIVGVGGVNFIEEDTWPTYEMESRGNPWGLLTGIVITIPSGMAVALSILSSASLLPPAVNTGLCLAVALVGPAVNAFNIDLSCDLCACLLRAMVLFAGDRVRENRFHQHELDHREHSCHLRCWG
ncbi:unnamed protein product, partial [Pylaiella littoralis]